MSYNVRIYKNSGYNSTNIPDSPALLNSASYIDLPALDILQERFLQSIKVKALWSQVKDADYCRLTDGTDTWFYSVESVNMLATDVAELGVIPDFINSVGGIGAITILDGITERVHVASDNYGEWNSDDYLLTPNEPLQIKQTWYNTAQSVTNLRTVIESTVDPYLTADSEENVVFQDSTGNYSVCVPKVQGNRQETAYKVGNADSAYSPKTCLYPFYNGTYLTDLSDALATLRSLGIEQAVIAQVHLPSKFINFTLATQSDKSGHIYYYVQTAQGKDDIINTSGLDYEEYTVDNNLINYSAFMKYGLMTASGNGSEFDPADIFDRGVTSPNVRCISDPHTDGKPYYRFETVNGDNSTNGFWRNCVGGMPWKQLPLVFQGASGSAINTIKFNNSQAVNANAFSQAGTDYDYTMKANYLNAVGGLVSGGLGAVGSALTGNIGGAVASISSTAFGIGTQAINESKMIADYGYYQKGYSLQRKSELANLAIANTVVTPTVNFPYNSDIIRDTYGNGVLIYRYVYSSNDVARIDKLLTMYGYKVAKALEKTDFTNRQNFNFVMCNNVSIGGFAKWINEGIAEQLKAGVRVWHVTPDVSKYTDNPIV